MRYRNDYAARTQPQMAMDAPSKALQKIDPALHHFKHFVVAGLRWGKPNDSQCKADGNQARIVRERFTMRQANRTGNGINAGYRSLKPCCNLYKYVASGIAYATTSNA